MPNWNAYSEIWLQRMIEILEPNISMIATRRPTETKWNSKIPTLNLEKTLLWLRLSRRLGFTKESNQNYQVRRVVHRSDVNILLAHYLEFALQFEEVWNSTSKPLFIHCHGYDITWDIRKHETSSQLYFDENYLPAVKRISERAILIANSNYTRQQLLNVGIEEERVVTKYYGIEVADKPLKRSKRCSNVEILYLGRLVDFKSPDIVIRAFDLACKLGLDGNLTIAGDGPLRMTCELLRLQSKYSDRISILGAVDRETANKLHSKADIFTAHNCKGALSHQEEALGVSVIEAMASAVPVISARSGALPETVIDGQTGFLVEPMDIEAHANALLYLANNPDLRVQMGLAGWKRAKEKFSLKQERQKLLQILGLLY